MGFYVGMDLHSNNTCVVIMNEAGINVFQKKIPNELPQILSVLENFREEILCIVFESTYNWYWLGDGLMDADYNIKMANPAANKPYVGLKFTDDVSDAYHLADLARIGILKEGYIYPKEERPIRDLLRKRLGLVRMRTACILSLEGFYSRSTGGKISSNDIKKLKLNDPKRMFGSEFEIFNAQATLETIMFLGKKISEIEKKVLSVMKPKPEFQRLLTIPGIGNILGLTIALETGDIKRFKKVGNYSSYARCVKSIRKSNDKKKGENNRKNGNKYLAWAFTEVANQIRRYCPYAESYYQRKSSKCKNVVAVKALSNKVSKFIYHILDKQTNYDPVRAFGPLKNKGRQ